MANGINTAQDPNRRPKWASQDSIDSAYANKAMSFRTYQRVEAASARPVTGSNMIGSAGRSSPTRANPWRSTPERRLTEPKTSDRGDMQRVRRPRNG